STRRNFGLRHGPIGRSRCGLADGHLPQAGAAETQQAGLAFRRQASAISQTEYCLPVALTPDA
ncbi:hypothetical protein ACFL5O_07225, partial [Myxococcota bacterium]